MDGLSEHDARLLVRGGRRLEGEVVLSGAKNSALKLLAASLLTADPCVIRRVPRITDVGTMVTMLRALGAEVAGEDDALHVRAGAGLTGCAPYELVRTMRHALRRAQAAAMDPSADAVRRICQGTEASVRFMAEHQPYFALLDVER